MTSTSLISTRKRLQKGRCRCGCRTAGLFTTIPSKIVIHFCYIFSVHYQVRTFRCFGNMQKQKFNQWSNQENSFSEPKHENNIQIEIRSTQTGKKKLSHPEHLLQDILRRTSIMFSFKLTTGYVFIYTFCYVFSQFL